MASVTPTNEVEILSSLVFKNNTDYMQLPFTMQKGTGFAIHYYCPTDSYMSQYFGYKSSNSNCLVRYYYDGSYPEDKIGISLTYPGTSIVFNMSDPDFNGEGTFKVEDKNISYQNLSVTAPDDHVYKYTVSSYPTPGTAFSIGASGENNMPGFKLYGLTLGSTEYVPAKTVIRIYGHGDQEVVGLYNQADNIFYYSGVNSYDYETGPETPEEEFESLFPTADVSIYSSLRYNDGDLPVEAYRVVTSMEALLASKTYEGELVSIVSDPVNNGLWHILDGTPRRIGFVY